MPSPPRASSLRAPILLAALLTSPAACNGGPSILAIDLPPLGGARSMILGVEARGSREVRAISLEPSPAAIHVGIDLYPGDEMNLEGLLFEQRLGELGLSEGPLPELVPAGRDLRDPTFSAMRVFENRVVAPANGGAWTERGEPSERLRELRIPYDPSCASFSVTQFEVGGHDTTLAIAIDECTALIGSGNPHETELYQFTIQNKSGGGCDKDPPDSEMKLERIAGPPGFGTAISGYMDRDRRLWIGTRTSEIWRTRLDGKTLTGERVATSTTGHEISWLTGPPEGGESELYVLTRNRVLEGFFSGRSEVLQRLTFVPGQDTDGGVAWLGPGEAVAVSNYELNAYRWRNGEVVEEPLPTSNPPTSVHELPGYGTLVGTTRGEVLVSRGDGWGTIGNKSELSLKISVFAPYEDGFLYAGPWGNMGQYKPGAGYCNLMMPQAFSVDYIVPMGDRVLMLGDRPAAVPATPFSVLRRARR